MGNVNMEAYQVHYSGDKSVADKLKELDAIAQQIEDLPTFTSDDRVFLEAVPAMPAAEGKTVLTAITDDQGETELTYETPEVESEDIAPEFSEEVAYGEGDLVYYEGILYKFTADHAAGAWDPSEVTQTTVAAEFNALKNALTNIGAFKDFYYPDISSTSDQNCVSTALADILTRMTEGSFIARIMRTNAWLLVCYGAVRNGIAYCNCFNTENGTLYVFAKQSGQDIQTIKTYQ